MISNWDVEFIYYSIIKENASHFWFYTHDRLRIKALLSAGSIILLSRPERSHSVTSAVHVKEKFSRCIIRKQNLDSLARTSRHTHTHTRTYNESCRTWTRKGQRLPFYLPCGTTGWAKGEVKDYGHKYMVKVNVLFGPLKWTKQAISLLTGLKAKACGRKLLPKTEKSSMTGQGMSVIWGQGESVF